MRMRASAPMFVLAALLCTAAAAVEINDPTRPPLRPASGPAVQEAAQERLELQSVLISPARRSAIINGSLVALGARIGNARLLQVSEDEAIVEIDGRWQHLRLFPAARKVAASGGTQDEARRERRSSVQNAKVVSVVHRRAVRD